MRRESESEENVSWNEIGEVLDTEMSTVEDIREDLARNDKGNTCQTSNMRSSGENVELRIVSERQPVAGAENVESTLEDAYLYHTQITGGEKNATL